MTATSYQRGWPIKALGKQWVYVDTCTPITVQRSCRKCRCMPTDLGHDACLGSIEGVVSACCGHGIEKPFREVEI
ncbi:hypothetical protein LCGC14_0357010 [marine sediment metagenome]|uniref:Uncharacterized protein n=1 Tax=marine sediment metagenome TaxID=412755 RepID=A0A0F9TRY7_9ZZZZ